MALDFHNEEYNKPKVATPEITTTGTPSVSTSPEPTKAPIPIAEKKDEEDNKGIGISKGNDSAPDSKITTIEDEYNTLFKKKCEGSATEEELKRYEEIKAGYEAAAKKNSAETTEIQKDEKTDEKLTAEQKEKFKEYAQLYEESGTDYEKTSKVLDKYLIENDESYAKLKESYNRTKNQTERNKIEQQMKRQRDKLIHDWQAVVNPGIENSKLSVRLRQRGIREIGKIFAYAGAKGLKQNSEELKNENFIKDIKSNKYEIERITTALKSIDFEAAKDDPDVAIKMFAKAMLKNDAKYNSLTGEAQEKYLQEKIASTISDKLRVVISKDEIENSPRIGLLKKITVSIAKYANTRDKDLNELLSDKNALKQAIIQNMKMIEAEVEKLPDAEKKDAKRFITHLKISNQITKKTNPTEQDILEHLKNKAKEKDLTAEEKDLFQYLDKISKIDPSLLNEEINLTSAVSLSIILGESIEQIGDRGYQYVNQGKTLSEKRQRFIEFVSKSFKDSGTESTLAKKYITQFCKENYNGDMSKMKNLPGSSGRLARAMANLDKNRPETIKNAQDATTEMLNKPKLDKNDETVLAAGPKVIDDPDGKLWGEIMSGKDVVEASLQSNNGAYKLMNTGYNMGHSVDAVNNAAKYIANNVNNEAYVSLFSRTSIEASSFDPKRQIELSKALLSQHNAAITEGVAAAEQSIDPSVRNEYTRALNNEINSGYYTTEQKANFQTARETGQTSFERTQSSEGAKSEASNLNNKTTSPISSSTPETGVRPTKVTISTIYISQESKTYAREIKTTLAQLDSENKKAEAMKKAADNIAKIQKDAIEREYTKAEQQKIQEQKQAVETAQKENDKKSEEKLKSDLAKAVDTSIEEIKEELPTSPEAAEVQKAFGEMFNELKAYAKAGQIDQVYSLLGKIPKAQEKFLEKLATKHISTITHFIKTADKAVIRQLCELNPSLIAVLDKSTLLEIGISKAKIIKYGDKDQIAGLLTDLQMSSTKDTLNEFYEIMGIKEDNPQDPAEAVKKNGNVNGGDDHMARLMQNMKDASKNNEIALSSNIVGGSSYRFPEGTKKKLDPKEFWG